MSLFTAIKGWNNNKQGDNNSSHSNLPGHWLNSITVNHSAPPPPSPSSQDHKYIMFSGDDRLHWGFGCVFPKKAFTKYPAVKSFHVGEESTSHGWNGNKMSDQIRERAIVSKPELCLSPVTKSKVQSKCFTRSCPWVYNDAASRTGSFFGNHSTKLKQPTSCCLGKTKHDFLLF